MPQVQTGIDCKIFQHGLCFMTLVLLELLKVKKLIDDEKEDEWMDGF